MSGLKIISQHRVESPDYALEHRSRMFNVHIAMHFKIKNFLHLFGPPLLNDWRGNTAPVHSAPESAERWLCTFRATWVFLMWNIWAGDGSFLWLLIYCQSGKVYEIWTCISMTKVNWVCLDSWCNFNLSSKHGEGLSLYSANTNRSRSESRAGPYLNMMKLSIVSNVRLLEIKACELLHKLRI